MYLRYASALPSQLKEDHVTKQDVCCEIIPFNNWALRRMVIVKYGLRAGNLKIPKRVAVSIAVMIWVCLAEMVFNRWSRQIFCHALIPLVRAFWQDPIAVPQFPEMGDEGQATARRWVTQST